MQLLHAYIICWIGTSTAGLPGRFGRGLWDAGQRHPRMTRDGHRSLDRELIDRQYADYSMANVL